MVTSRHFWNDPVLQAYREAALGNPIALSPQEIAALIRGAQADDVAARDRLVAYYQRLAFGLACRYARCSRGDVMDLVHQCNLGLLHALRKYAFDRQASFSTYAVRWMMHYCLRWLEDDLLIAIPSRKQEQLRRAAAVTAQFAQDREGGAVEDAAISARAGITLNTLCQLRQLPMTVVSLHELMLGDEDFDIPAPIPDEIADEAADPDQPDADFSPCLRTALDHLSIRERTIVLTHTAGQTFEQIAPQVGRSRERTRQLYYAAITKLRTLLSAREAA